MSKTVRINTRKPPVVTVAWTEEKSGSIRGQIWKIMKKLRKRFYSWLKQSWSDEDSTLRRSTSLITLIIYSFLGSTIFYSMEKSQKNYWQCLSYVNSIFSTIGYGNVKPDTISGKVFTIFYAIIGIPMIGVAASDFGFIMMYWLGKGWVRIRRIRRIIRRIICSRFVKRTTTVATVNSDDSVYEKGNEDSLPLSLAFATLLCWLLLSSFYFHLTHPTWTFFISFYFFFISVSTIGLGDYLGHEDTPQTMVDYAFVIGGMALFSLCLRLFVAKMESVDDKIAQSILKDYTESLQQSYAFNSDDRSMQESESKQRKRIRRMIRKKAGFMRYFLGKKLESKMLKEYKKRANMRLKSTQTTVDVRNVATSVWPNKCDVQTMAGESYIAKLRQKRGRKNRKREKSKKRTV